jgi:uncharacterized membrane-anchored protein
MIMTHTSGSVFAATAAFAGSAAVAFDLVWALLLLAILIAMFATVFRLVRSIGEGPAKGRRPLPLARRQSVPVLDLR